MSLQESKGNQTVKRKTRRSKKRRTADVSDSDSDSDSDSNPNSSPSSGTEMVVDVKQPENDIQLSDFEMSEEEDVQKVSVEGFEDETREKLNHIPLTTTELSKKSKNNINSIDLKKVQQSIQEAQDKIGLVKDGNELKNSYLNLLFNYYGEDANSLRDAPDFTPKSLVLLANVLKDGANMFDVDTLKTIVESRQ